MNKILVVLTLLCLQFQIFSHPLNCENYGDYSIFVASNWETALVKYKERLRTAFKFKAVPMGDLSCHFNVKNAAHNVFMECSSGNAVDGYTANFFYDAQNVINADLSKKSAGKVISIGHIVCTEDHIWGLTK